MHIFIFCYLSGHKPLYSISNSSTSLPLSTIGVGSIYVHIFICNVFLTTQVTYFHSELEVDWSSAWHKKFGWSIGEHKTKPTQASVRELRGLGLSPDLIFCRSEQPIGKLNYLAKIHYCRWKMIYLSPSMQKSYCSRYRYVLTGVAI